MNLQDWLPISPMEGPPLPKWLGLRWPWYNPFALKIHHQTGIIAQSQYDNFEQVEIDINTPKDEAGHVLSFTLDVQGMGRARPESGVPRPPDFRRAVSNLTGANVAPVLVEENHWTVSDQTATLAGYNGANLTNIKFTLQPDSPVKMFDVYWDGKLIAQDVGGINIAIPNELGTPTPTFTKV